MKHILAAAVAAFAITAGSAQAAELIQNGSFETSSYSHNTQFGADFGGQGVANWTGLGGNHLQFYYLHNPTSENATNQFGDPKGYFYPSFDTLSPDGGAFIGLDGDSDYSGQISQTENGLEIGKSYKLTFNWAASQLINRTGATTEFLRVGFGDQSFDTETLAVPSGGFSGWKNGSFTFTATQASQVLSFLSVGTPNGLPPIAALDGVSLTAVPEPAVWSMMLMGFAGLGAMIRRRRALAA